MWNDDCPSGLGYNLQSSALDQSDLLSGNVLMEKDEGMTFVQGSTEDLMIQRYLQKCVQYHHEQAEQCGLTSDPNDSYPRIQAETKDTLLSVSQSRQILSRTIHILPSSDPLSIRENHDTGERDDSPDTNEDPKTIHTLSSSRQDNKCILKDYESKVPASTITGSENENKLIRYQEAVERAREIAQRLATSSTIPNTSRNDDKRGTLTNNVQSSSSTFLNRYNAQDFGTKRRDFLVAFSKRLHTSLLKNLEYISKKEERKLADQMQLLHQHVQHEEKWKMQLQMLQEKKTKLHNTAGIGTKARQKLESKKRKLQSNPLQRYDVKNQCAVYITGLPTTEMGNDGNNVECTSLSPDSTVLETSIQALFGAYGKINRVTLYQDKVTGKKKGDGLVVYDLEPLFSSDKTSNHIDSCDTIAKTDQKDRSAIIDGFVSLVCSQLNGVEMPNGSTLTVEPASSDYRNKKNESSRPSRMQEGDQNIEPVVKQDKIGSLANDDSDLDSFFASIDNHPSRNGTGVGVNQINEKNEVSAVQETDQSDALDDFFASL